MNFGEHSKGIGETVDEKAERLAGGLELAPLEGKIQSQPVETSAELIAEAAIQDEADQTEADNLLKKIVSGDLGELRVAATAARTLLEVTQSGWTPEMESVQKEKDANYNNPEVVHDRLERSYKSLVSVSQSNTEALFQHFEAVAKAKNSNLRSEQLKVVAGKDPSYLANDLLSSIAKDLSLADPSEYPEKLSQEREKYLSGVKQRIEQRGLSPKIIDVLASEDDQQTKISQLERFL